jgi:N-acetylglucosaminyl-diphospho-decaprenol L-rhamnosyltransferase
MARIDFSFIIVTYNSADTIQACLESIVACTSAPHEVVVVDNSPNSLTLLAVDRFIAAHPGLPIRIVKTEENIGFGRACNRGASLATGNYLFFLNPDTQLWNDAAAHLANCFNLHPYALAAGPAILDHVGKVTLTCRNLPTLGRVILDATGLDTWFGAYKLTRFSHATPRQVEQIIGAAMLIPRQVYESLNGMDERFFIYFEEVDLCKRLLESGGQIWFWPEAQVQHLAGSSCEVQSVRARTIYTLRDSRSKYFAKHFGKISALALVLVNRIEALQKLIVFSALWAIRRKSTYREKAYGFWTVAIGSAPRP